MININVILKNAEVRGVERKTSSKGNEYLVVRVDDERGERSELLDRDLDNEQYYKRGTFGDFLLHVTKSSNSARRARSRSRVRPRRRSRRVLR